MSEISSTSLTAAQIPTNSEKTSLAQLEQRYDLWRGAGLSETLGEGGGSSHKALATGHKALDSALKIGGWPSAGLLELLLERPGIQELSLLMPAIAQSIQPLQRVAFVGMPYLLLPMTLKRLGVKPQQVWTVQASKQDDQLWATQQLLKSGHCLMVVSWQLSARVSASKLRKLQVAAKSGGSCGVVVRHERWAEEASPASMRLQLRSQFQKGLEITVRKQPGTFAGQSLVIDDPLLARQRLVQKALPVATGAKPRSVLEHSHLKENSERQSSPGRTLEAVRLSAFVSKQSERTDVSP